MNQRQEFEQRLTGKAMKDMDFRKQLIDNPNVVIESEMGLKIPENVTVKVLEEDAKTIYLVLPHTPVQGAEMELTDAELQSVAGGTASEDTNWTFPTVCW
jgi:hypothetical protein